MAEVEFQGRVIETRAGFLTVLVGGSERAFMVRQQDAEPGDYVWIYDDGQVEVKNRPPRLPLGVTETTFPTTLDGQDHS